MHQRNARRAVGIVLDRRHPPRHSVLLALEVDQAQLLLVAAALMADGQVARVAASARALARRQSGLCGLSVVRSSLTSVVWKRSVGVIGLYVLIAIVFVLENQRVGA
jgi:hypothetical protein